MYFFTSFVTRWNLYCIIPWHLILTWQERRSSWHQGCRRAVIGQLGLYWPLIGCYLKTWEANDGGQHRLHETRRAEETEVIHKHCSIFIQINRYKHINTHRPFWCLEPGSHSAIICLPWRQSKPSPDLSLSSSSSSSSSSSPVSVSKTVPIQVEKVGLMPVK